MTVIGCERDARVRGSMLASIVGDCVGPDSAEHSPDVPLGVQR